MRRLAVLVLLGLPVAGAAPAATSAPPLRLPHGAVDSVSWSHDGRWLAVVRYVYGEPAAASEVRLIRRDGGYQQLVVAGRSARLVFAWARKANAFVVFEFARDGLLLTGVPGRRATVVGTGFGSLDATGRRLAFVANGSLFVADRIGRRRMRLTDATGPLEWSPDGREIVFGRRVDRGECGSKLRLFLIRPNGAGQRPVTPDTRRFEGRELVRGDQRLPRWSPDGRRLLIHERYPCGYSSFPEDDPEVLLLRPRSARPALSLGRGTAFWSPAGTRIAIDQHWTDARGMWIVSPDGRRRAGAPGKAANGEPSWSADGRRITFSSSYAPGFESRVLAMRADGRRLRALAEGTRPVWSPREERIVFVRRIEECGDVLLSVPPSGGRVRALTRC